MSNLEASANKPFERLVYKMDPQNQLLRTWTLQGGVSAKITALEILSPNQQTKKMVVRQYGEATLKQNLHVAENEFKLLKLLQSENLPIPQPYFLDESREILATPYVVIEFIDGQHGHMPAHVEDFLFQFAGCLARIHRVDCSKRNFDFLPKQKSKYVKKLSEQPANSDESWSENRVRGTLKTTFPQNNQDVLLHGDFWPRNTLWREEQLVAVIDWENAALGEPLSDLANARLEILWAFGWQAMHDFTSEYKTIMSSLDFTTLAHWDLYAAMRLSTFPQWGLSVAVEKNMHKQHSAFVKQALTSLNY